jgi:hypothetical protein
MYWIFCWSKTIAKFCVSIVGFEIVNNGISDDKY